MIDEEPLMIDEEPLMIDEEPLMIDGEVLKLWSNSGQSVDMDSIFETRQYYSIEEFGT